MMLADLPSWLEDFIDNLVNTEMFAPAHSSRESDLEHPEEVVTNSRKHSIYTHFPKVRNREPKLQRHLAEDALAKLSLVQKSLVTGESQGRQ